MSFDEFKNSFNYFNYDVTKYTFQEMLKEMLGYNGDLEQLHDSNLSINNELTHSNDQNSVVHRAYYDSPIYKEFVAKYHEFIRREVLPLFDEQEFAVQAQPTFRCCQPNNTAVGRLENEEEGGERIGFHRDFDFNHPASEINFVLCFTDFNSSNGFHFETSPNKSDYRPVDMEYGQFFQFYGSKCRHYNTKNISGQTRISVDFRVIPMSQYDDTETKASIQKGKKFTLGGYYMKMKKDDTTVSRS